MEYGFVDNICEQCALLLSLYWFGLHSGQLLDSLYDVTSVNLHLGQGPGRPVQLCLQSFVVKGGQPKKFYCLSKLRMLVFSSGKYFIMRSPPLTLPPGDQLHVCSSLLH